VHLNLVAHDHYWTGRVLRAYLAYRAEEQTGEAAVATRADDQQFGITRLIDQHGSGVSLLDALLDPEAAGARSRLGDDRAELGGGDAVESVEVSSEDKRYALEARAAAVRAKLPA
jgi:hypothetical protein